MDTLSLPPITRDPEALSLILTPWRQAGEKIGFVPTMGALHDGHLSLIHEAKKTADKIVVSVFVNPKQFAPTEDFSSYPRTEEDDLAKIAAAGGDVAYLPGADIMYPDGYQTVVTVPKIAAPLDGTSRPHFFGGVATVVAKLFGQVRPDVATFGEKDFQQLLVIQQMVADLNMGIDVQGAPIIREADGLAMSSRNRYLSAGERAIAAHLNQIMRATTARLAEGAAVRPTLDGAWHDLEAVGLAPIDYFELRRVPTLDPVGDSPLALADQASVRLFAAVMLGKTRLIDNMPVSG